MRERHVGSAVFATIAVVAGLLSGCGPSDDIRTVADFDANPCALFTEEAIKGTVAAPYLEIEEIPPTLTSTKADNANGAHSCVYAFSVPQASIPEMATFTVAVSHQESGNQPLALCVAGASTNNPGYKMQDFADMACTTPSTDVWMRVGEHYFHVVLVPQPGFSNPVERSVAISPVLLAVAKAAADRMPKS